MSIVHDKNQEQSITPSPAEAPSKGEGRQHLTYLEGLRALAALYVVLYHVSWEVDHGQLRSEGHTKIIDLLLRALNLGHYAVDVFIVLSGFCLMLPIVMGDGSLKGGALRFFKRRAIRILPPYYLTIAVSMLLIVTLIHTKTYTIWDDSIPVTWQGIWGHLLLVQDALPSVNQINHSLWSISVEWRIYFVFPLLVLGWRRLGPLATSALSILASAILVYSLKDLPAASPSGTVGLMPQYLGLFTMGMLGAEIAFAKTKSYDWLRNFRFWPVIVIAGILVRAGIRDGHAGSPPMAVWDYFVGLWAVAILIGGSRPGIISTICSWRPFAFIGAFAYSLYLMHAPIIQVIWQYVWQPMHLSAQHLLAAQIFIGVPLTVLIAWLFYRAFEQPFHRMARNVR